jgi:hypothetical protein
MCLAVTSPGPKAASSAPTLVSEAVVPEAVAGDVVPVATAVVGAVVAADVGVVWPVDVLLSQAARLQASAATATIPAMRVRAMMFPPERIVVSLVKTGRTARGCHAVYHALITIGAASAIEPLFTRDRHTFVG